jgi:hypothetical protein
MIQLDKAMWTLREPNILTKLLVSLLCIAWLGLVCASDRPADPPLRGERTADDAARPSRTDRSSADRKLSSWEPSAGFLSAAFSDTTETDFPEDKEEENKHLYRDIGVFLFVSAFVGYFIVKVFIQKDKESPPSDNGGKPVPGII